MARVHSVCSAAAELGQPQAARSCPPATHDRHPACHLRSPPPAAPIDPLLVFHVVFGKTVPDISLNAVANLGYADGRFLAPVFPGDTLRAVSEVIGVKENSNGKTGVVWVRTTGYNQENEEVLSYVRWVMVNKKDTGKPAVFEIGDAGLYVEILDSADGGDPSVDGPNYLGKIMRVLVFTEGEAVRVAQEAGADFVGSDDLMPLSASLDRGTEPTAPNMPPYVATMGNRRRAAVPRPPCAAAPARRRRSPCRSDSTACRRPRFPRRTTRRPRIQAPAADRRTASTRRDRGRTG